ncbi:glutathione S-transferase U10-like [Abrus precatorius]|uniref:Glutathione S-transferase n=1 Tax=Abrus precatorius TaxID=3816 RepID=A0A8B8M055_ABRPR|nr:glutathione S-transferase U10-like [Abrus precatorius]
MDEKNREVVLLGSWPSAYCTRVALALKLKGIPYKYVEEDLKNKSELLIKHNPVHKKVPVLLHKGRSICESLVILEYIDDIWNHSPKLLPEDPYQRAKVRFWANYFDQKIMPGTNSILLSNGEAREKAIEDMNEMLRVFEEGVKEDFHEQLYFFNEETLGLLDIVVGSSCCTYKAYHEACNIEVIGPNKNPTFFMWVNALKEHPLMKETLPPHDKLVAKIKSIVVPSPIA